MNDGRDTLADLARIPTRVGLTRARLIDRLAEPDRILERVYARIATAQSSWIETARGVEWLLDNHYVVSRAMRLLYEEFPAGFERRLPQLDGGDEQWRGLPRAYVLAREILRLLGFQIDLAAATTHLTTFQAHTALTIAELWALPALFRLVVLEHLAAAAAIVVTPDPEHPEEAEPASTDVTAIAPEHMIARCIRGLHLLETTDWSVFVERLSVVDKILRDDPAGVYPQMNFETRDRYRRAVEEIARRSPRSEPDVATAAVERAHAADGERHRHIGHFLIDRGRPALEAAVGCEIEWRRRARRWVDRSAGPLFIAGVALWTAVIEVLLGLALHSTGVAALPLAAALLLFLIPALTVAVGVINAALTRVLAPCVLPKLDFDDGLPASCRTLVAVPALLTDRTEIDALCEALEVRYLANRDPHLQFALLTDFTDATEEHLPGDVALLRHAESSVRDLNRRHGAAFHLLHRPRRWNHSERCWMGWERKRGKLEELNRLLLAASPQDGEGEAPSEPIRSTKPGVRSGSHGGSPSHWTVSGFTTHVGEAAQLSGIRFVIVLDADTELPRGAARRMVAAFAHPLNQAARDARGRVVSGYTILQPRVELSPTSVATSWFARLFTPDVGLDPYTHAVSDVYQDLLGQGVFIGKGIYDVAAFAQSVHDRVPENALLSHDLFEGLHGRAALLSDVILLEDYPAQYLGFTRRLHRWARGDWQLLPWLGRTVPLASGGRGPNRLNLVGRWMVLDNLRRSLLLPSLICFLLLVWFTPLSSQPGRQAAWTILAMLVLAAPALADLIARLLFLPWSRPILSELAQILRAARTAAVRWFFEVAFAAHQAAVLVDAIVRTWVRVYVTQRHLLQWTPARQTARRLARSRSSLFVWREMASVPILAALTGLALAVVQPAQVPIAAPLLLLWFVSPQIALLLSRPRQPEQPVLTADDHVLLRRLARRTWYFFETFTVPEDQWLPPDHFQEDPRGVVARRTSPTNIGFLFLSTLAAHDFGYRGLLWIALRMRNTLDTMDRMERHRGHFLNWYDTATLDPLPPKYVSTVDSGNLAGCLVAVAEACAEWSAAPVVDGRSWDGLCDTMSVLDDVAARIGAHADDASVRRLRAEIQAVCTGAQAVRDQPAQWAVTIAEMLERNCHQIDAQALTLLSSAGDVDPLLLGELRQWVVETRRHLERMRREVELFLGWLAPLQQPPLALRTIAERELEELRARLMPDPARAPRASDVPAACDAALTKLADLEALAVSALAEPQRAEVREWIGALVGAVTLARQTSGYLLERLADVRHRSERFVHEMDFTFVYDERRHLFHLGYDITANRLDEHHFDLLASEARLASFLAIAKGDVPEEHWLHLGRPIGRAQGERTLLSWSGTMFEYLMPIVLLREGTDTLLGRSCRAAVAEQIAYGRRRNIPWGISESGYYRFDAQQNYQYRAFGVPGLGFKRGLEDDLVVAPYATVLALPLDPRAVIGNLRRLQQLGGSGPYGLYEALDFTLPRLGGDQQQGTVRSYMAHHQGMILTTLDNYLHDNVLVRRFHAAPAMQTAEPLLFERPARRAPIEHTRPEAATRTQAGSRRRVTLPAWEPARGATPEVHVLANGRYSLFVADDGGSWSNWRHLSLTRANTDVTLNDARSHCYVRDIHDRRWWALTAPSADNGTRRILYHPHLIEMQAQEHGIATHVRMTVAPDSDVEIRHVTITNESTRRRQLRITSYAEVVLDAADAYARHPAFSKLFIECEYLAAQHALLLRRRPKTPDERPIYLLHMLLLPASGAKAAGYETARDVFLGRGGSTSNPALIRDGGPLRGEASGAPLDPIMALAADVELGPQRSRQVFFITGVAPTRAAALELAARYRLVAHLDWTFDLARDHAESELRACSLDGPQLPAIERLLSLLVLPRHSGPDAADVLARNERGRQTLWRHGISGDIPVLCVRVREAKSTALLHEILRAHAWWRRHGVRVDLAILNEQQSGYSSATDDRVYRAVRAADADNWLHRPGGVFVVRSDQIDNLDRLGLLSAARVVLDGDGDGLADQLARLPGEPARLPPLVATTPPSNAAPPLAPPTNLVLDNGLGGFTSDGREYVIHLAPNTTTPAPWCNVIANPRLGCVVSESGGGYTWAGNSGESRLTSWRNDPVGDAPSETIYLRDEETGAVWSATPAPAPGPGPYEVRHGAGYTDFVHSSYDLEQHLRLFVAVDEPVKIVRLTVTNRGARPRRLTVTYFAELVLGTTRDPHQQFIVPEFDAESQTLLARNPWRDDLAGAVAFVAASRRLHGFTADRTEFFGRGGARAHPAALRRLGLAGVARAGIDPCAALQLHVDLAVGQSHTLHFLIGQGADRGAALALARRFREPSAVDSTWADVGRHWDAVLGAVQVETPDAALNVMLNRWLLYQAVSSRFWGRTGYYQSSGAFGFRDQLQDVAALLHAAPALCRSHLLDAAAHQFVEGDVLHWWHPPAGAGIRTRCSDDLLWLPFITAHYVTATGDNSVLDEDVPYLAAEPLRPDEDERYGRYAAGASHGTLYDHCVRAIERGDTAGRHGLPLIGTCDWNDGMNRVGHGGQGESVWLGQFLYATLLAMLPLCRQRGDSARADDYRQRAHRLRERLEAGAWDGRWYRRGYYDDGTPLGSAERDECRIDSLAQSWAVLSGAGDATRARTAVVSCQEQLVRETDGLTLLFAPPFDRSTQNPGYVKAYPPGIRENGGQYTHAAVWLAWAVADLGDGDFAHQMLSMLLPTFHTRSREAALRYRVEPYVVAADIYGAFPHTGRGGWTWYTGSAAWAYRLGIERILGLHRRDGQWSIDPCIPTHWQGFTLRLRDGETVYVIEVENPGQVCGGVAQISIDGVDLDGDRLPRLDDGKTHRVHVRLGMAASSRTALP